MPEDQTIPPRQPNTPRTILKRLWYWAIDHSDYSIPLLTFVAGWLMGKLI